MPSFIHIFFRGTLLLPLKDSKLLIKNNTIYKKPLPAKRKKRCDLSCGSAEQGGGGEASDLA